MFRQKCLDIISSLNDNLTLTFIWLRENQLIANPTKFQMIIFGFQQTDFAIEISA